MFFLILAGEMLQQSSKNLGGFLMIRSYSFEISRFKNTHVTIQISTQNKQDRK